MSSFSSKLDCMFFKEGSCGIKAWVQIIQDFYLSNIQQELNNYFAEKKTGQNLHSKKMYKWNFLSPHPMICWNVNIASPQLWTFITLWDLCFFQVILLCALNWFLIVACTLHDIWCEDCASGFHVLFYNVFIVTSSFISLGMWLSFCMLWNYVQNHF